jgi:YVTN family beta-propeller protein
MKTKLRAAANLIVIAVALVINSIPAQAQSVTATITAGALPSAVAVNPVTNKTYVANQDSNNVTVIDGATNNTTTVPAG